MFGAKPRILVGRERLYRFDQTNPARPLLGGRSKHHADATLSFITVFLVAGCTTSRKPAGSMPTSAPTLWTALRHRRRRGVGAKSQARSGDAPRVDGCMTAGEVVSQNIGLRQEDAVLP